MTIPSAYQIEQVMSVALAFAERLRADGVDGESLAVALASETDALAVLERVVRAALDAEGMADAAKARLDDLAARRARFVEQGQHARGVAFAIMDALGVKKHVAPDFTVALRAGLPSAVITDEEALPEGVWRVTRAVDKTLLKQVLENGPVPGAEIRNGMPSLTIRTK